MSFQIFVYIQDSCYQIPLEPGTNVTIGSGKRDILPLPESGLADAQFTFRFCGDKGVLKAKPGVFANGTEVAATEISVGDVFTCGNTAVYICPKQSDYSQGVRLSPNRDFTIGRSRTCDFGLSNQRVTSRHAVITCEDGTYKLTDLESKNHTFVNGRRISSHDLKDGDVIWIAYYGIVFESGELFFLNAGDDLRLNPDAGDLVCRYPFFRRSPRLGASLDVQTVEVPPPAINGKPEINWFGVFLPPVVMAGVSAASVFLYGGNLASLLFILPMSLVTVLTTIVSYGSQVRRYRRENRKKQGSYEAYMEQLCLQVKEAYEEQYALVNRANPETAYCLDIVSNRMRRLWERTVEDPDFLEVRLGKGELPLEKTFILPQTAIGEDMHPEIVKFKNFLETMNKVKDIAVTLQLRTAGLVGVVGNRQIEIKAVKNILIQLATHHSYSDLKLVIVADEKSYEDWSWARWIPHTWDRERQTRFVSSNRRQACGMLEYWEEILKRRVDESAEKGQLTASYLPHLVFVITDPALTEGRDFLRHMANAGQKAGASAFLLFDSLNKLPKECEWFVEVNHSGGSVYARTDSGNRRKFTLDSFDEYEKFARLMAPVRDRSEGEDMRIPASVTFFQGYEIEDAAELNIEKRWALAKPYQSLAVPIGIKENGKAFWFDIHEKAHGPHGLAAGTTGSGKSEVLQTYILSMCVHFPPQAVSFVLIDFKGAGLAGALKDLPHIAGVITDMDENIQRNLFSLEAEIERRKKLFADVSDGERKIQDIYEYQKAYYNGSLSEPLSHLIMVIDEFTELKSAFPDFMAAVERAARVGRTLGIHLILATQKPGGSVSDEIRANSNFKWCLRVKEGESREVLGRAEAEAIPQEYPGRTYIQVGNNELFELVQIYYSGGDIRRKSGGDSLEIAFVDSMGQREKIKTGADEEKPESGKELFALVKYISNCGRIVPCARKIWVDCLPKRLILNEISSIGTNSLLSGQIGLTDDPRHQKQYPCEIDFENDGHLIIYGAAGTGKTMLLQTLVMSLAERYTPKEVHIYIIDFGSYSMQNLGQLPHVGDIANGNEKEKIQNLIKMLIGELERRKMLFAGAGAGSFRAYRQSFGELPAILVIVDNIAPIREAYEELEDVLIRLTREGSGFGLYFVVTATALGGEIGWHLSQNFRQALALHMAEKGDYRDIVGDTDGLEPLRTAGRGLVRGKPAMEFQTALAVLAENDGEYVSNLKAQCQQISAKWEGKRPRKIPVMPEIVLYQDVKEALEDGIVLGLSEAEITPVILPWENHVTLISGMEKSGKTGLLRTISRQLTGRYPVVFISAGEDPDVGRKISEIVERAQTGEKLALLVDDIPSWIIEAEYEAVEVLERLMQNLKEHKLLLYASGEAFDWNQENSGLTGFMVSQGYSILLGGSFSGHGSPFEAVNLGYTKQDEELPSHYGYLLWRKKATCFKVLMEGGRTDGL